MFAFGPKQICLVVPRMSRLEPKQTWCFALQMSAYDPKLTYLAKAPNAVAANNKTNTDQCCRDRVG